MGKWTEVSDLKEKIECALRECGNGSTQAAAKLGMSPMTFYRYCTKFGIRKRRPGGRGTACMKPGVPLHEILEGKHPYGTTCLKQRLFDEGLKKDKCEKCGVGPVWNGERLTLQLDHIDGDRTNHRYGNLRILCPNCHSQTLTWGSKRSWTNGVDKQELKEIVKSVNEKHPTLYSAAKELNMSPGHLRRLLIRFDL